MAVTVERRLHRGLKVEIARIVDQYGAVHLVQQSIMPLATADPNKVVGKRPDGSDLTEAQLMHDWHEANIDDGVFDHGKREEAVNRACTILQGEGSKPIDDPMEGTGYKGCCSGD